MYYKYRNADTRTENILIEKEIWLSKPEKLNDSFECNLTEFLDIEIERHINKIKKYQLMGFIHNASNCYTNKEPFYDLRGRAIKSLLNKIKKHKNNLEKQHKIANDFMINIGAIGFSNPTGQLKSAKNLFENLGVFSLTENPLNIQMWAHYANNQSGLALGFKPVPDSDLANPNFFQPVEYADILPDIELDKGLMNGLHYIKENNGTIKSVPFVQIKDSQIQKILFTKTTDWSHEKEWRYLRNKYGKYPFPGELKEVIFGIRCPQEVRNKFINLCLKNFSNEINFFEVIPDIKQKGQIMLNVILVKN